MLTNKQTLMLIKNKNKVIDLYEKHLDKEIKTKSFNDAEREASLKAFEEVLGETVKASNYEIFAIFDIITRSEKQN